MSMNNKLLVVEDDPGLQDQLRWCFDRYEVVMAGNRVIALEQVRRHRPPVVARVADGSLILDLRTVAPEEEAIVGAALLAATASV